MHLLAGLGNPGARYAGNRHKVGVMVVERLAAQHGQPPFRTQFQGRFARTRVGAQPREQEVGLLVPDTFMNLSGRSVQPALRFFKLGLPELVVVHDELDLPFGAVRVKVGGGTAGHKGLASIVECCGGQDFCRLRIGIGRPPHGTVENYVLGDFSKAESAALGDVLERATSALVDIVVHGAQAAMNVHNRAPA
jgi:PTH1 family peptidyl-tRNA hydrolase